MALKQELPKIIKHVQNQSENLKHNADLFDIDQGSLLKHILKDLQDQLHPMSFQAAKHRVAPINVLRKLISKLSTLYSDSPQRIVIDGNDKDIEMLNWYEDKFSMNQQMSHANRFFNLFKNTFLEPYTIDGEPRLRVIPSDRFTVYGNNPKDDTKVEAFIKMMGTVMVQRPGTTHPDDMEIRKRFYVTTDEEFLIVDDQGQVLDSEMSKMEQDGANPFGRIPGVYINASDFQLIPDPDSDLLSMSKLLPILLSDLNYAVMFQAFSIIYGVDVNFENLEKSPNAFWSLKSDPETGGKPEVGSIKPQVDIDQVLGLVQGEMALWMESRDIRPGSIGKVQDTNFASGVAKMIDEADTTMNRKSQIPFFQKAEMAFWDTVMHHLHPIWTKSGEIEKMPLFSADAKVWVEYDEPSVAKTRVDIIREVEEEMKIGLLPKRRAAMRLNPDMDDDEIDELLEELKEEEVITIPGVKNESGHIHELDGQKTSGPIDAGNGMHTHKLNGMDLTSEKDGPGHTHATDEGERTSGPIEPASEEDKGDGEQF